MALSWVEFMMQRISNTKHYPQAFVDRLLLKVALGWAIRVWPLLEQRSARGLYLIRLDTFAELTDVADGRCKPDVYYRDLATIDDPVLLRQYGEADFGKIAVCHVVVKPTVPAKTRHVLLHVPLGETMFGCQQPDLADLCCRVSSL